MENIHTFANNVEKHMKIIKKTVIFVVKFVKTNIEILLLIIVIIAEKKLLLNLIG